MLMDLIKNRHSIRKYTNEQIRRADLEKILEAGNYAPNAGGGQRSMMVAVHNRELAARIGHLNMAGFDRTHLAGSFVSREQPSTSVRSRMTFKIVDTARNSSVVELLPTPPRIPALRL